MPTFSPFRTLTPFPKPAIKESVLFYGDFGEETVTTSTLNLPKFSLPFWWLLYKVSFSVNWEFTTDETYSGSFGVEFLVNPTSPNQKICSQDLLLVGGGDWISQPSSNEQNYDKFFAVEPFQCELVHVLFWVLGEQIANGEVSSLSPGFSWYITSAPPPREYYDDQNYNLSTETLEVNLPDGNVATLNKCVDFFDADYEDISATSSISDVQFEWYELEN